MWVKGQEVDEEDRWRWGEAGTTEGFEEKCDVT